MTIEELRRRLDHLIRLGPRSLLHPQSLRVLVALVVLVRRRTLIPIVTMDCYLLVFVFTGETSLVVRYEGERLLAL